MTETMTKAEMREEIASDLEWIEENDGTLWRAWQQVEEDYADSHPVEVRRDRSEAVYILRDESGSLDFALATYEQSEPRFASWVSED